MKENYGEKTVASLQVYAEADPNWKGMHIEGEHCITVSSLTKVHGLGPIRYGWIIAAPHLIERIGDAFHNLAGQMCSSSILFAEAVFPRLHEAEDKIRTTTKQQNRQRWNQIVRQSWWCKQHTSLNLTILTFLTSFVNKKIMNSLNILNILYNPKNKQSRNDQIKEIMKTVRDDLSDKYDPILIRDTLYDIEKNFRMTRTSSIFITCFHSKIS